MILNKDHPDFIIYELVNGKHGIIKGVKQFDTETKEAIILLTDDQDQLLMNVNNDSVEIRVCLPYAVLRKIE